jgi:hypothetical protein
MCNSYQICVKLILFDSLPVKNKLILLMQTSFQLLTHKRSKYVKDQFKIDTFLSLSIATIFKGFL